jgi:hypothetical protein
MSRLVIACAVLPALACSTYAQHRAALVPRATPYLGDGQPLDARAQLAAGASNLGEMLAPSAGDPDTGVATPGVQLEGAFALRATKNLSFSVIYDRGLDRTAHPANSSEPPIHNGDSQQFGFGWAYSIDTGTPGFRVGIANQLLTASVPWIQYTTCTQNCDASGMATGNTIVDKGSTNVPIVVVAVVPSYRTGRFTVFGGITARNHPNVIDKITTDVPLDPDITPGPLNVLAHVGASVELGAGIRAALVVHQEFTGDPVRYGPGVAATIALPLGRDAIAPARQP